MWKLVPLKHVGHIHFQELNWFAQVWLSCSPVCWKKSKLEASSWPPTYTFVEVLFVHLKTRLRIQCILWRQSSDKVTENEDEMHRKCMSSGVFWRTSVIGCKTHFPHLKLLYLETSRRGSFPLFNFTDVFTRCAVIFDMCRSRVTRKVLRLRPWWL